MTSLRLMFAMLLAATQVAAGLGPDRSDTDDTLLILTGQQTQLASKVDEMSKEMLQKLDAQQASTAQLTAQLAAHDTTLGPLARRMSCQLGRLSLNTTTIKGTSYFFSYDQPAMTWADAGKFCEAHFMDLLSLETSQEWFDLLRVIADMQVRLSGPWSSGTNKGHLDQWKWAVTGTDVIFQLGNDAMDKDPEANCLFLSLNKWGNLRCDNQMAFICETNYDC